MVRQERKRLMNHQFRHQSILTPGAQHTPEQVQAYGEGWDLGRAGYTRIRDRYQGNPPLQDAYFQGFYDAHAGREKRIDQPRAYEDQ